MVCFWLRHQLRTKVRSMDGLIVLAEPLTAHATGFSQWLMTNFSERRIHSATLEGEPKKSGARC